jgi:hypothetical protein
MFKTFDGPTFVVKKNEHRSHEALEHTDTTYVYLCSRPAENVRRQQMSIQEKRPCAERGK